MKHDFNEGWHKAEPPTAEQVRAWRGRLGLSRVQLAKALGRSVVTISRWETGYSPVPASLAFTMNHASYLDGQFTLTPDGVPHGAITE